MEYNCEWLKHHINDIDPPTFPCEWAKRNWHKTASQITEPFPCDNLREKWEDNSYRTVLYTDGTFIINEKSTDIDANVQAHGEEVATYPPLDAEHDYVFESESALYWANERALITAIEVGSSIQPTSMARWFWKTENVESVDFSNVDTSECISFLNLLGCTLSAPNTKLTSIDVSHFDTSKVENMQNMFGNLNALESIDVTNFDTSNTTTMHNMFAGLKSVEEIDVSNFDTSSVTTMRSMFANCTNLQTIYASVLFDTSNVSNSNIMFVACDSLVGGQGTTYVNTMIGNSKTYARIDNPPDAPGYFTEK